MLINFTKENKLTVFYIMAPLSFTQSDVNKETILLTEANLKVRLNQINKSCCPKKYMTHTKQ